MSICKVRKNMLLHACNRLPFINNLLKMQVNHASLRGPPQSCSQFIMSANHGNVPLHIIHVKDIKKRRKGWEFQLHCMLQTTQDIQNTAKKITNTFNFTISKNYKLSQRRRVVLDYRLITTTHVDYSLSNKLTRENGKLYYQMKFFLSNFFFGFTFYYSCHCHQQSLWSHHYEDD